MGRLTGNQQGTWLFTLIGRRNGQIYDYRMIPGLWPITFSLVTPIIIPQCTHGQSGPGDKNEGHTWTQKHDFHFHSSRPTWLWPLLSTETSNTRDQPSGYHALNACQPGGRLITVDSFHHGRGNVLFLLE